MYRATYTSLCALLAIGCGASWDAARHTGRDRETPSAPVTVTVVDTETGEPLSEFTCKYWVATTRGLVRAPQDEWVRVKAPNGTFPIEAPPSCEVSIWVKAPNCVDRGYPSYRSYVVLAEDKARRIVFHVVPGITVRGTVKDARTKAPIAGALVSPVIFTPPAFTPDWETSVKTDDQGRYQLRGVDPGLGIHAFHPDHLEARISRASDSFPTVTARTATAGFELKVGDMIQGVVRDPAGKPIQGVGVGGGRKSSLTAGNGTFVLKSVEKLGDSGYWLTFEAEGYIRQDVSLAAIPPEGLSVVLMPRPKLAGQVLDEKGKPVPRYLVSAGPGRNPGGWECTTQRVDSADGRFSLTVKDSGDVWIGVQAEGYAVSETWSGTRDVPQPLTVHLLQGASVRGRIAARKGRSSKTQVKLVPEGPAGNSVCDGLPQRLALGAVEVQATPDGLFRLDHIRPDRYVLHVFGQGITPTARPVVVSEKGLNVGTISVQGTGTVFGRLHTFLAPAHRIEGLSDAQFTPGLHPRLLERYMLGFISGYVEFAEPSGHQHLRPIWFRTDESGRFRVDNVPVGKADVVIPYMVTADIKRSLTATVRVSEGEATEVRLPDPEW